MIHTLPIGLAGALLTELFGEKPGHLDTFLDTPLDTPAPAPQQQPEKIDTDAWWPWL